MFGNYAYDRQQLSIATKRWIVVVEWYKLEDFISCRINTPRAVFFEGGLRTAVTSDYEVSRVRSHVRVDNDAIAWPEVGQH